MSHCPWTYRAISIAGDSMIPCCRYQGEIILQDDPETEFKQGAYVDLRKKLDSGEKISECYECWADEKAGVQSLRQKGIEMWGYVSDPEIKYAEFDLDNTCNLKCVSCNVNYSSAWASEEKKIFGADNFHIKTITEHYEQIDLSKLETVKLFGGEPLLSKRIQKLCKNLLTLDNLTELTVYMNTNATVLPKPEIDEVLLKCKKLILSISVDGIGDLHNFVRHGVDWNILESNLDYFDNLIDRRESKDTVINIHTTAHIYNINYLHTIRDYFKQHYPRFHKDVELLFKPKFMSILNAPKDYRQTIIKYLKDNKFEDLISYLENDDIDVFDYFITVHNRLINLRKIDMSKLNTHLHQYIQNYSVSPIDNKRLINLRMGAD